MCTNQPQGVQQLNSFMGNSVILCHSCYTTATLLIHCKPRFRSKQHIFQRKSLLSCQIHWIGLQIHFPTTWKHAFRSIPQIGFAHERVKRALQILVDMLHLASVISSTKSLLILLMRTLCPSRLVTDSLMFFCMVLWERTNSGLNQSYCLSFLWPGFGGEGF